MGRSASDDCLNVVVHEIVSNVFSVKLTTSFAVFEWSAGSAGGFLKWFLIPPSAKTSSMS